MRILSYVVSCTYVLVSDGDDGRVENKRDVMSSFVMFIQNEKIESRLSRVDG